MNFHNVELKFVGETVTSKAGDDNFSTNFNVNGEKINKKLIKILYTKSRDSIRDLP